MRARGLRSVAVALAVALGCGIPLGPSPAAAQALPFHTGTGITAGFNENAARSFVTFLGRSGLVRDGNGIADPMDRDIDVFGVVNGAILGGFTPYWTYRVIVPWVDKSMDFTAPNGGRAHFGASGVGDAILQSRWIFFRSNQLRGTTRLGIQGRVTVPLGETDATLPGGEVAPRPLQVGNGSWDVEPTLIFTKTQGRLDFLSPPSRRRIFRQAKELLAAGVSRAGVLAYLVSAQTVLVWMLVTIVALDGPQPVIGLVLAVAVALGVLLQAAARLPDGLWEEARERARASLGVGGGETSIGAEAAAGASPEAGDPVVGAEILASSPLARTGPGRLRPLKSVAGQAHSLWWPLLFGTLGVGFFLALGQSPGYLSLQGTKGPLVQVGALAATAWWWGLHGLAGVLGLQDAFHAFADSTLRPDDVPWFHHWFAPGL